MFVTAIPSHAPPAARSGPLAGTDPRFEIAAGTVPGRHHLGTGRLLVGRNNQDAFAVATGPAGIVAAVCDGCSAGARSEVGAILGARWAARAALDEAERGRLGGPAVEIEAALERVRRRVLARLLFLARTLGPDPAAAIEECMLFTLVLAVVGPAAVVVAAVGDGLVAVNGALRRLGPFAGNAPPYLGYGLLEPPPAGFGPDDLRLRLIDARPVDALDHLAIGSDGAWDLAQSAEAPLPGTGEPLGPLAQFWSDDRYFASPDALRRRLALANSERTERDEATGRPVIRRGLLPDDTTLVVIRRRRLAVAEACEGRRP